MAHRPDSELTPGELARRNYHRAYRAANREKLAVQHQDYYFRNREEWRAWAKEYYRKNAKVYKERAKQYRRDNAAKLKAYWRERKTGCSPDLYAKLLAKQGGVCAICGGTDPRELCADHDHGNGKVRGLLCRNCNLGIGHLRHDVTILRLAIRYLRKTIRT